MKQQKEVKYVWVKVRTRWASGLGDWEFKEVIAPLNDERRAEIKEDYDSKNYWSEHYRGIDIKRVAQPPLEELRKRIDNLRRLTKLQQAEVKRYGKQIQDFYGCDK